jgi:hypothetical protein
LAVTQSHETASCLVIAFLIALSLAAIPQVTYQKAIQLNPNLVEAYNNLEEAKRQLELRKIPQPKSNP